MTLIRRSLAALAAALMLGGPALAATPQTMTGAWVKVANAGSGLCVTVSTDDSTSATQIETSVSTPPATDRGRVVNFYNPVSGYVTADLWAKGPAGSTVAVDVGFCAGGGAVAGGGGGSGTALQSLALANTTATTGSAFNSTITGTTSGSTVAASSNDGTALTVSGGAVSGTFAAAGPKTISLTETLSGAINSPKTSTATVTVSNPAPVLQVLTLSPQTARAGVAYSGTIGGATAGSSIAAASSDGTALSVSGSTVSGTFAAAGSPSVTLTETLAGATGSPKSTQLAMTVSAATPTGGAFDFSDAANSGLAGL